METPKLINVVDPDTNQVGSIPAEQLQEAQSQGYVPASTEQVNQYFKEQEFGTPGQQVLTGLESAAGAATFNLSKLAEEKLGLTTKENIKAREEVNPIASFGGELAGLAMPFGEGAILGKAGKAAAELAGLTAPVSTLGKIGSSAVKTAAETALYQSGNEAYKLATDPEASVPMAISNIGLTGLFGGALGAGLGSVSPLWTITGGSKLTNVLKKFSDKIGGIEGEGFAPAKDLVEKAGIEITPEAKSIIANDPYLHDLARPLIDSETASGKQFQAGLKQFNKNIEDGILNTLGKSESDVDALTDFSSHKAGSEIQNTLKSKIESLYAPIEKDYEAISNKYKTADFNPADRAVLQENLAKAAQENGWVVRESSPEASFVNRALKDVGAIDNLEKLRQFGSSLSQEAVSMSRWDIEKGVRKIFDDAEDAFVRLRLSGEAPELLAKHDLATTSYREIKDMVGELNARLRVGASKGVKTFLYKLADMEPEKILNRLAQKNDAGFVEFLKTKFPEIQEAVNQYHINNILKASTQRLGGNEVVNPTTVFSQIQKLTPELRNSLLSPESQARLDAMSQLWKASNQFPKNYSKTAGTADLLNKYGPASAAATLSFLTGHNPIIGGLIGHVGRLAQREAPDAVRLSLIKFLSSDAPIHAPGFKSMVDFLDHAMSADRLANKAAKNIFKAGVDVLPSHMIPSDKKIEKLQKQIDRFQVDQKPLLKVGGETAHYLPDHGTQLGQTSVNALNYLSQMKPKSEKMNPLDKEIPPSKIEKATYDRMLTVAEQPLMVLDHIKKGTLLPQDIGVLKSIYPSLYNQYAQKLMNSMTDAIDKEDPISYKTRMSLSLFFGRPLDSTLTPEAIQSAQISNNTQLSNEQQQQPDQRPKHSMTALNKLAPMYSTPGQSAEAKRIMK